MAQLNAPFFGPNEPLVKLAEQRRLPRHQNMDPSTLRWIANHRPSDLPTGKVSHPPLTVARYALVPSAWYAQSLVADSIHGLRHGARVAILAAHLARLADLPVRETLEAVIAGALHDCRREHDQDDPGHGYRAARWFAERHANIMAHLLPAASDTRGHVIATAMELHEVDYPTFTGWQQERYAVAPVVCDIVKTADALDRYRLPKLKWWPNHDYLRIIPPPWLHRYAFDLMLTTERHRLDGLSSERAVMTELAKETL
jgi:hypothetical protein